MENLLETEQPAAPVNGLAEVAQFVAPDLPALDEWERSHWLEIFTRHQQLASIREQANAAFADSEVGVVGFVRTMLAKYNLPSNVGVSPDGQFQRIE